MKFYIALGGIGCRTLKQYALHNEIHPSLCFYIDTDPMTSMCLERDDPFFLFPGFPDGADISRQTAGHALRRSLYVGALREFFSPLEIFRSVSLCFFTSSFDLFGSTALPEVVDYLESICWEQMLPEVSCEVYAYTEGYLEHSGIAKENMDRFFLNTAAFCADMAEKVEAKSFFADTEGALFAPCCRLHLIDTHGLTPSAFADKASASAEELAAVDSYAAYLAVPLGKKSVPSDLCTE